MITTIFNQQQKRKQELDKVLDYSVLRDYQNEAIEKIENFLKEYPHAVLSIAPSGGKTFTSLFFIRRELEGKGALRLDQEVAKGKKIVIIPHGQVVLKTQWQSEIGRVLTREQQKHVIIEIAQNLKKIQEEPCFVVVDEAHQFYFADTITDYLKKYPNVKRLLLTGTPSKFIYANDKEKLDAAKEQREARLIYPIHFIDGASLIEQGFLSDLAVHAVSTVYELDSEVHFTATGDVNEEGVKLLEENVESDLTKLLEAMFRHLRSLNVLKRNLDKYTIKQVNKYAGVIFNGLYKTQIACASVDQARAVHAWLEKRGIKSVISEYEEDRDSEKIQQFINDPEVKVLVVVNRAVLGFNLVQLGNVVDMTGSRNIDRIYQLMSRVTRKSEEVPNKFFYKVSNALNREVGAFYLEAALCLMFKEFSSKWNGKNLGTLRMPVEIKIKKQRKKKGGKKKSGSISVPRELFEVVNSVKILRDIVHKADGEFESYKMVTFGEIEKEILEIRERLDWSYEMIDRKLREAREADGIENRGQLATFRDKDGNLKYATVEFQARKKAPELLDKWFPLTRTKWTLKLAKEKLLEAKRLKLSIGQLCSWKNPKTGKKEYESLYAWLRTNNKIKWAKNILEE